MPSSCQVAFFVCIFSLCIICSACKNSHCTQKLHDAYKLGSKNSGLILQALLKHLYCFSQVRRKPGQSSRCFPELPLRSLMEIKLRAAVGTAEEPQEGPWQDDLPARPAAPVPGRALTPRPAEPQPARRRSPGTPGRQSRPLRHPSTVPGCFTPKALKAAD